MKNKTLFSSFFYFLFAFFGFGNPLAFSQTSSVIVDVTPDGAVIGVPFQGESYYHIGDFVIHGADFDIVLVQFNVTFSGTGNFSIQVKENGEELIYQTCMLATDKTGTLVEIVLREDFCCFPETLYQVNCGFQSEGNTPVVVNSMTVQAYRQQSSGLYPFFPKTYRPTMLGWDKSVIRRLNQPSKIADPSEKVVECHVITLGALLDLSGPLSSMGKACKGVLDIAIEDFNRSFKNVLNDQPVFEAQCVVYDTKSDPQLALEQMQALSGRGIRFVLGPTSSAEAAVLKPFVDENGIILISPASTAPSLAIAGDHLYRFTVDDTHQGKILPEFLLHSGIKAIASVYRSDTYGQALSEAVQKSFTQLGGNVLDSISYSPDETDFSAIAAKLDERVRAALEKYDASTVAIHVAAFNEIVEILELASAYPALAQVRWFGCDANPQDIKIIENPVSAQFAYTTCFTAPIFGGVISSSSECKDISTRAAAISQTSISSQALAIYDSFQVIVKAIQQANYATSEKSIRTELESVANHFYGITGAAALNEAGDRKVGNFDFWNIQKKDDGTYQWVKTGILIETDGSFPDIIYYQGCPCSETSSIQSSSLH